MFSLYGRISAELKGKEAGFFDQNKFDREKLLNKQEKNSKLKDPINSLIVIK